MRILGIDPGFERLGVAILEKPARNEFHSGGNKGDKKERVLFSECFKTSAKLEFPERLFLIGKEIKKIIKKFQPEILAIETLFFTSNQKTVMHVAEVRGVAIFEASPPKIKIAITGYGKANKEQVMKMVRVLVEIAKFKTSDDELDAIAIALTAFAHMRF